MSLHESITMVEDSLTGLHEESAREFGKHYAPRLMTARKSGALPDDLLTVGVVGGTGVGKSTLINALAQEKITLASHRRPTTTGVIPYVHADRVDVIPRISFITPHLSSEMGTHRRDDLRGLLIFDLPDMDSLSTENAATVNEVLAGLDIVIWMTSITKYADRVFHQWITNHVGGLDVGNLLFVINKVDEISASDGANAKRELTANFQSSITESLATCGATPDAARFFALSALNPGTSFEAFRDELLRERDEVERIRIRSSNRLKTLQSNIAKVAESLYLPERREILDAEMKLINRELAQLSSSPDILTEIESALSGGAARTELAAAFFDAKLKDWPILRHVQFLLSPLTRIGTLIEAASHALAARDKQPAEASPPSTVLSEGLAAIQKTRRRARSQRNEPPLGIDYIIKDRRHTDGLTTKLRESGAAALRAGASEAVGELKSTENTSRLAKTLLIYGPLIWFPFLQPVLEEILKPDAGGASLMTRLAYRVVRSAGAIHLVVSAAFVLVIYAVTLLALRALSSRAARHECHRLLLTQTWRERFVERASSVLAPDIYDADISLQNTEGLIDELQSTTDALSQSLNHQ